jgi:hypothetical protein
VLAWSTTRRATAAKASPQHRRQPSWLTDRHPNPRP